MRGLGRRSKPVTRAVMIKEYDRSLVTTLVVKKSPALWLGPSSIRPDHGHGVVIRTIAGRSREDLEWLEAAVGALGGQVEFMPIRQAETRNLDRDAELAVSDGMVEVAHAAEMAAEGDAVLNSERLTGRAEVDDALRRIVQEGRAVRRRALDRDKQLVSQYLSFAQVEHAALLERRGDGRRYDELRDEYELMRGEHPDIWPF